MHTMDRPSIRKIPDKAWFFRITITHELDSVSKNTLKKKDSPNLPNVLEPKLIRMHADEAPNGEDDDPEDVEAKHLAVEVMNKMS
jgi:hypothetical protein